MHPCSLISAFVVHCLDTCSIIPKVSISNISSLYLASVAMQAGLSHTLSQTPKTGFLVMWFKWQTMSGSCLYFGSSIMLVTYFVNFR